MTAEPRRPDPQAMLVRVQRDEARAHRGRLKVWLGAAPGVGKTYAMLAAARRRQAQGQDVVVGCVETHGRRETAAMLSGLTVLPRREVQYRGVVVPEFDLEAALARRPAALLVDELAHTNVPGSRFGKRWEDVQALLDAGIDVETTLNVQHLESLVDVVAQITGVQVRETVPDRVVEEADEVVVVDLSPDALLERLRDGKVYAADVAVTAAEAFFRKGNLTALRELALRKAGQWVDSELQTWRREHGVAGIWGAGERILVAVGPSPSSARLVRAAHRTAAGLRSEWFAIYVETPRAAATATRQQREQVTENLRLAEALGARTATVRGDAAAPTLIDYARAHDIARIVIGKSGRSRLYELVFGSLPMDVIRQSGDIDVHVLQSESVAAGRRPAPAGEEADEHRGGAAAIPRAAVVREVSEAALLTAASIGVAAWAFEAPDLSTEAMLLVVGVVLVSLRAGRWVALAAVVASAGAFNFLFLEPRFTFLIADPAYAVAFAAMLVIGFTMTALVARARERADLAQEHEQQSSVLYSLARELADAATEAAVARATVAHLRDLVAGDLALLLPLRGELAGPDCIAGHHGPADWLGPSEFAVARWCLDHGRAAGAGTANLPGSNGLFLPLVGHGGRVGVLALCASAAVTVQSPKLRLLVGTLAEQAALAIERVRARREQLATQRAIEAERLRSTLLASVSHDLRTPLATITGAASSLLDGGASVDEPQRRELLHGIAAEASRLDELIGNLVHATRIEAGDVALRRDWTSVEEIVGAALRRAGDLLGARPLQVAVAPSLPLVQADPVLLEQAVFLLLDNAARHTPPATPVTVRGHLVDGDVCIEVRDEGPGIADADRMRVFQRFERGPGSRGMGLGLPICAAILRAHGGAASLLPSTGRGAAFQLRLPRPTVAPPVVPEAAARGDRPS